MDSNFTQSDAMIALAYANTRDALRIARIARTRANNARKHARDNRDQARRADAIVRASVWNTEVMAQCTDVYQSATRRADDSAGRYAEWLCVRESARAILPRVLRVFA